MRGGWIAAAAALVVLVGCGGDDGGDEGTSSTTSSGSDLSLESLAFADGGDIPDEFTCEGANAIAPLDWSGVPDGVAELALIVEDPDAPTAVPFVHWVVWGIDPASAGIAEGTVPAGAQQGANGVGQSAWAGPCPPPGDGPHRYVFTLYALSEPAAVEPGASADELRAAIGTTTLATAELTGLYGRT